MGRDEDGSPSGRPSSLPPETADIDSSWDDAPLKGTFSSRPRGGVFAYDDDDDSIGDRITAVPDIPMAVLAADLLAEADHDASPTLQAPAPDDFDGEAQVVTLGGGATRTLRASLGAPQVPHFGARGPGADAESVPPSWVEPALDLPLSSHSEPPVQRSGAGPPDARLELDFESVFPNSAPPSAAATVRGLARYSEAEPVGRDDAAPAVASSLPPPRDDMPTLELGIEFDQPPAAAKRRSLTPFRGIGPTRADGGGPSSDDSSRAASAGDGSPATVRAAGGGRARKTGIELQSEPPPPPPRTPHQELHDRYAVGDFTGALVIAESLLEQEPDDVDATRFAQSCRDVLMQMYTSRMGALDAPVRMTIPADQIRWLSLDHRAGFLLSLVDGSSSVEEILDICGMPRLDALRLLYMLLEERVIAVERRGR